MRFSAAVAVSALAAGVSATYNYTAPPSYTTEVVTEYTTYCPGATEITYGGQTYTATSETTLTITNCPCTVTYPVTSSVVTSCSTCTPASPTYVPPPSTYVPPPAPYTNATSVYTPTPAPSSPAPYTPTGSPVAPTNAANKAVAGSGAGLAAVLGFVAYVL